MRLHQARIELAEKLVNWAPEFTGQNVVGQPNTFMPKPPAVLHALEEVLDSKTPMENATPSTTDPTAAIEALLSEA